MTGPWAAGAADAGTSRPANEPLTADAAKALRTANRHGVMAITAGMAVMVGNDALAKYVSETLPAPQVIFLRSLTASVLLLAMAHAMGALGRLAALFDRRVMARAVLDALAAFTFLISLFHIPLANVMAINMTTPLIVTVLAVLFFREQVNAARWLAIAVGFIGVLLIVQPSGAQFDAYALLCLLSTVIAAIRDFGTRLIDRTIPSVLIALSTGVVVTLLAAVWTVVQGWQPVQPAQLGLLAAAGALLSGGYFLLTVAMRTGEISLIAPFRYSGLVFALVLGYAVWRHVPNAWAWAGIALLLGAGLWLMRKPSAD